MIRGIISLGVGCVASHACLAVTIQQVMPAQGAITTINAPVINSSGKVAFVGYSGANAIYTWSGGALTNITPVGYTGFSSRGLDINDSGNVAYVASTSTSSAIFVNSSPIYSSTSSSGYDTGDGVAINNAGNVAFIRRISGDTGFYLGDGTQAAKQIFDANSGFIAGLSRPAANASGLVAFPTLNGSYAAIFTSSGAPAKTLVIDGSDSKVRIISTDPAIDAAGDVLFRSDYQTGQGTGIGLFLKKAGQPSYTEIVAPATSAFASVVSAAIAPDGTYAFLASMDDGSRAIYYGKDGSLNLLVSTTQQLNGQGISGLYFGSRGISSDDRIVFGVTPTTGNPSIYYAQVPEPGIAAMITVTTLGLLARRKERRIDA